MGGDKRRRGMKRFFKTGCVSFVLVFLVTGFVFAAPKLISIAVTPANPSIALGLTQQFTATGTYSNKSTKDITTMVTWSSSQPGVATIDGAGLATSVAAGSATIKATAEKITGSATLTVTAATLSSLSVTPADPSIALGLTQQFSATGTYSDSSTKDLTASATWTTSNAAIATIDSAGLATAVALGSTTITAKSGDISGDTTLRVDSTDPGDPDIHSLSLITTVEIANGARPEIIATADKVFVVYLNPSTRSFNVLIYKRDMSGIIGSATLVESDPTYGSPTDIRVVSDGVYLYAFYETCYDDPLKINPSRTYLFGAKYRLDLSFSREAYTGVLAESTKFTDAKPGDEKLDDPAPMLNGDEVYAMTRFRSTLAPAGETIYRFRKFNKDLQLQEFAPGVTTLDLDLSSYADGEARQSSIIFETGFYYLTVQTAVGPSSINNDNIVWSIPANLLIVKLDANFAFVESKTVSAEPGYTEGYVTGLQSDSKYFYVTYNHVKLGTEFSSVIHIFDKSWNTVVINKYKSALSGGLRPSIEVTTNQVLAGNDDQGLTKAYVFVFNKQ
jgi:hypothetical protein